MSLTSTDNMRSSNRADRIRSVVSDYVRDRAAGARISRELLIARYPDLAPDLADELEKLDRIDCVLDEAEDMQYEQAAVRIAHDWHARRSGTDPEPAAGAASSGRHVLPGSTGSQSSEQPDHGAVNQAMPSTIGRYRVRHQLGEGAFGAVYLAWDEALAREVAIKVTHAHLAADPKYVDNFLAEARAVARLDHPAIVPVYDIGRTPDGCCYVVSKWIRGIDLQFQMQREQMDPWHAVQLVSTIADALHYAHQRGLIHRDVKPANILLAADGTPYLGDFGLALSDRRLGKHRSFAGTPAYMSPEQARGEAHRVDGRSDIFSLGVVLYELITGKKPFQGETHADLFDQIFWSDPTPPSRIRASIVPELDRICLKAMSKRAGDRYRTAAELVEDLRHSLDSSSVQGSHARRADARAGTGPLDQPGARVILPPIIPKGLRPFDASDSKSFLPLIPGPRDRDGLPESIRRWKVRIEAGDLEDTFAVGVLYGPSGCGKSSLVRAGLVPRMAPHVHTVYVEATADRTEDRIVRRLLRRYPELASAGDLSDCLAALRRGCGPADGSKLVLIIDQFEQWLHGRREADRRLLVQALRQCDGPRLQCLLLVRDDFWLALSRFMTELEIDLDQRHNAALVDLFDPTHAVKVLAEFGRAFGQIAEDPSQITPAHKTFLQRAIADLTHEDKVVPVQLALFADMVKDKPWNPGTLRNVGGLAGIGVTFLEGTFSAQAANPQYRIHEAAARAVLEALLPEDDNDMKGQIRSYPELLDQSGYGEKPRAFKELIRILDGETRLITPADPEVVGMEESTTHRSQRYYQLTHDYLVPALREWLTRKRRLTRTGRSELRLASRTAMWQTRPERRQLPSFLEWISIRLLTRSHDWTPSQHSMMRAATRHHVTILGFLSLFILIFLFGGLELTNLARNGLLEFRARNAAIWMAMGNERAVWPILKEIPDPTPRTRVIHGLGPMVVEPAELLDHFSTIQDLSVRRAILLICGELIQDPAHTPATRAGLQPTPLPEPVLQRLVALYRQDPDPGIHAAAGWVLKRCQHGPATDLIPHLGRALEVSDSRSDCRWSIDGQGHTMVVIAGPTQFLMGGADGARADLDGQSPHLEPIRRSFRIASTETTVAQYQQFLDTQPASNRAPGHRSHSDPHMPATSVSWFDAAAYCNWLSEVEGLPPEEWCYLPNEQGLYAAGMRIAADFLDRRGYRLPTECEWEYACRAGAGTAYAFGADPSYLKYYGLYEPNSEGRPQNVATRKPNDFGLFDMHGNAAEWCQDSKAPHRTAGKGAAADRIDGAPLVAAGDARIVRGGSYRDPAQALCSMARDRALPNERRQSIGFRVARSYP